MDFHNARFFEGFVASDFALALCSRSPALAQGDSSLINVDWLDAAPIEVSNLLLAHSLKLRELLFQFPLARRLLALLQKFVALGSGLH